MAIKDWSTTPASNDTVTDATYGDINWEENQAPNTLNNSSRSEMAHVRAFYENTEWRDFGHTVARTGNTTFEISGDVSSVYVVNRRLKCTDSSTIYATVTAVDYNVTKASFTTVTVETDSGNLSASLSAVEVGPDPTNSHIDYHAISIPTMLIQRVEGTPYTTYTSSASTIAVGDSTPQIGDGAEYVTVSITPKSATNRLVIRASYDICTGSAGNVIMAIFQDTTADALTASLFNTTAPHGNQIFYEMAAGTTSSTTFRLRLGVNSGTLYVNGNDASRLMGGVSEVRISVEEYA